MAYVNRTSNSQNPSLDSFRGRSPKRLTITIPFVVFSALEQRSVQEGRSLSNLAAFLIEQSLNPPNSPDPSIASTA